MTDKELVAELRSIAKRLALSFDAETCRRAADRIEEMSDTFDTMATGD